MEAKANIQHNYNHIYWETFIEWRRAAQEIIAEGKYRLLKLADLGTCPIREDSEGIVSVCFINEKLKIVEITIKRADLPKDKEGAETTEGIKAAMRHKLLE